MVRRAVVAGAVLLSLLASPSPAELVDRVVAAVDHDVITLSDLRTAVLFNTVIGGRPAGRQTAVETLEGLINRKLLLQEASRLKIVEVSEQDIDRETATVRRRAGDGPQFQAFLDRAGMTEQQLRQMLGERLAVERFVERKIELYARVSRTDAENYYREHAEEFKGRRYADVQKQIIALLSGQMASQQLDSYVAELRARADIRTAPLRERDGF